VKNSHPPEGSHKLFVGGLPEDISEDELRTVFNTYGEVVHVHIMKANSMTGLRGAFVFYDRKESAEDAIKVLNDVYKIRVDAAAPIQVRWGNTDNNQRYQQQQPYSAGPSNSQEANKLFAGSLPPDITEEELKTVFGTYGEVTNVHLMAPHNKTGMRAALVFYTKREAGEDAIRALNDVYKFREDCDQPVQVKWGRDKESTWKGDKGGGGKGGWGGASWGGGDGWSGGGGGWGDGKGGSKGSKGGGWQAIGGPGGWQDSPRGGGAGGNWQDGWSSGGWQDKQQGWSGGGWQGGGGKDWGGSGWGGGKGGKDGGKDGGKCGGGKGGGSWDRMEPTGKLFVGNLPEDIQDSALEYVFGTYGKVQKVHIMNNNSKNGAIAAFVEYNSPEEAETAIASLNEKYEIRPGFGPMQVKHANNRRSRPY